jgi:hypothetical protein
LDFALSRLKPRHIRNDYSDGFLGVGASSQVRDFLSDRRYTPVYKRQNPDYVERTHVDNAAEAIDDRVRFFVVLSTGFHSLCKQYDAAVTKHNETLAGNDPSFKKHPTAMDTLFTNKLMKNYKAWVGDRLRFAEKGKVTKFYHRIREFGRPDHWSGYPTDSDGIVDCYCKSESSWLSDFTVRISVGDYPVMHDVFKQEKDTGYLYAYDVKFIIPFGVRVEIYKKKISKVI